MVLSGHVYESDPRTGVILLPYARTRTPAQQIVLSDAWSGRKNAAVPASASASAADHVGVVHSGPGATSEFCTLSTFLHEAASYTWNAGLYLDREGLLAKSRADIAVRATVLLNGCVSVPASQLQEVSLTVETRNAEGVCATQVLREITLSDEGECVLPLQVPEQLRTLSLRLDARVWDAASAAFQCLAHSELFALNSGDDSGSMHSFFLRSGSDGFTLACLGRTGEAVPGRGIELHLKHAYLVEPVVVRLVSDLRGCVYLGHLHYFTALHARGAPDPAGAVPEARFDLGESRSGSGGTKKLTHPRRIHVLEGERVLLPWAWPHAPGDAPTRVSSRHLSLAEVADSAEMDPLAPAMLRDLTGNDKVITLLTAREAGADPSAAGAAASQEKCFLELRTAPGEGMRAGRYQLHFKDLPLGRALVDIVVAAPAAPVHDPGAEGSASSSAPSASPAGARSSRLVMGEFVAERRRFVQIKSATHPSAALLHLDTVACSNNIRRLK